MQCQTSVTDFLFPAFYLHSILRHYRHRSLGERRQQWRAGTITHPQRESQTITGRVWQIRPRRSTTRHLLHSPHNSKKQAFCQRDNRRNVEGHFVSHHFRSAFLRRWRGRRETGRVVPATRNANNVGRGAGMHDTVSEMYVLLTYNPDLSIVSLEWAQNSV